VGQVNCKPQYLVFSSHFQYPLAKSRTDSKNTANFAVESANSLIGSGLGQSEFAQNPVQKLPAAKCPSTKPAYAPQEERTRGKTGANPALPVGVVDNWVPIIGSRLPHALEGWFGRFSSLLLHSQEPALIAADR
jgi:hypothetical protein